MVKCHLMGMGKWRTMNYIRGHGHFEVNNCSGERSQVLWLICLSLSICLALSLSRFIYLDLFINMSVSLYLSVCLSLSLFVSVWHFEGLPTYLPTYLPFSYLSASLYLHVSPLFIYPYRLIYLSLFICLSSSIL